MTEKVDDGRQTATDEHREESAVNIQQGRREFLIGGAVAAGAGLAAATAAIC